MTTQNKTAGPPRLALAILLTWAPVLNAEAATIPTTHGTLLSGKEITIPQDLLSPVNILIVGFSQKSGDMSTAWDKKIRPTIASNSNISCYEVPNLSGAPKLVRGFIIRGIKKDTPDSVQAYFLPVFEHEEEWKIAAGFRAPDDAYILVVNRQGEILWKTHGAVSDQALKDLNDHLNGK